MPVRSAWRLAVALLAVCLVASSNYVLNELQDAPYDVHHPVKRHRPVPSGLVNVRVAYVQWIALGAVGVGLGLAVNVQIALTLLALWVAGCIYNLPPVRSKDQAYVDVVSEAINNPIRMLVGWFVVTTVVTPPASLLVSYWMFGCYLMAAKRFAEYRDFGRSGTPARSTMRSATAGRSATTRVSASSCRSCSTRRRRCSSSARSSCATGSS